MDSAAPKVKWKKTLKGAQALTSMEFSMELSHTRWGTERTIAPSSGQCQPFNEVYVSALLTCTNVQDPSI